MLTKNLSRFAVVIVLLLTAAACSSNARIGTRHHHVSVGGSAQ